MSEYSNLITPPDEILAFLKSHLTGATQLGEIDTLMASQVLDSAWVYLGGSGMRQQIFLLHGNLRVIFQFDADDWLVAYGVYRSTEPWEKGEADVLVSPVSSSDVSLIFVPGKMPGKTGGE